MLTPNYHGKLKFVGSQLLKSRPDLRAATKAYTATTWFLKDQMDMCASGSTSTFNNPEWFYRHVEIMLKVLSHSRSHNTAGSLLPVVSESVKCPFCDMTCTTLAALKIHIRSATVMSAVPIYRKDVDGFLKVNMVRFETVEVTKEIMKNMAKKPQSLRKVLGPAAGARGLRSHQRAAEALLQDPPHPPHLLLLLFLRVFWREDISAQASPRGSDSPVYCVMSTIPHIEDEPGGLPHEDCDGSGTSGAVQALTEVARASAWTWRLRAPSRMLPEGQHEGDSSAVLEMTVFMTVRGCSTSSLLLLPLQRDAGGDVE
ncbi:hypothetical protein INR49_026387, partial [Caranx melampygus]